MSIVSEGVPLVDPLIRDEGKESTYAGRAKRRLTSPWVSFVAILIGVLWTIPTIGLFITSIRPASEIATSGWWTWFTDPSVTLDNYRTVLFEGQYPVYNDFINSIVITIPAVIIPVVIASMAAYAFAWMKFPMRDWLFVAIFALQIVPIQVALIPLLRIFVQTNVSGTFWAVWIAHSIFALPLAIFLLHNFMKEIPAELIEAARVDGAGHVTIFFRVMLPLIIPAIAAFGVFQFLWVWNDLLVSLTFASRTEIAPLTVRVAELSGTQGTSWELMAPGAFIAIIVPLVVFLALQRFFVRGLLAGSVKG
jgi:alpha-glucoside transport system permease protein